MHTHAQAYTVSESTKWHSKRTGIVAACCWIHAVIGVSSIITILYSSYFMVNQYNTTQQNMKKDKINIRAVGTTLCYLPCPLQCAVVKRNLTRHRNNNYALTNARINITLHKSVAAQRSNNIKQSIAGNNNIAIIIIVRYRDCSHCFSFLRSSRMIPSSASC